MRKYVAGVVFAFVALAGFTVFGAAAPFQSLKVHLSESAKVAQTELPAGDYIVRYVDIGADVPVLSFEPTKGDTILVTAMRNQLRNGEIADKSMLVFAKTDGNLTLNSVQVEGLNFTYDFIPARAHNNATITH
jgi:hypothetical protein